MFWQVGNLGPMAGQISHFVNYAPQNGNDYARDRYRNEYNRCLGVLDRRLEGREFIAGEYSIADIASWPWLIPYKRFGQDLAAFPNVKRWHETMKARPAASRGIDVGSEFRRAGPPTDEERGNLFGQTAQSTARARES